MLSTCTYAANALDDVQARRRQHAQITGTVDVGDDDAKDKKKKKKEKKDKKKSKKGKKEPKVKSRVQGSWGR